MKVNEPHAYRSAFTAGMALLSAATGLSIAYDDIIAVYPLALVAQGSVGSMAA
jgi:hypothetical protein